MARIRSVKPEFFKNDELAALPALDRIAFIGLWTQSDRRGRLEERAKRLKAEILPYDDVSFEDVLGRLAAAGFIVRYVADGVPLIQVVNFEKHQRITGKEAEAESEFPPPQTKKQPGSVRVSLGKRSGSVRETTETTGKEGKGKEGIGEEGVGVATSPEVTSPTPGDSPIVLTFPTSGKPNEWHLRQSFVDELQRLYPGIDPVAEARLAKAKIDGGAVTRKTASGMNRFLFSWMDRATNSTPARARAGPAAPELFRPLTDAERFLAGEPLTNDRA